MKSKLPMIIAFSAIFIGILVSLFSQSVTVWTSSTVSDLGAFLGGILGPIALLVAALQYFESSEAQKAATRFATEERHRLDLRNAYEKRVERLDAALDDKAAASINGIPTPLRELLATALFLQTVGSLPDHDELGHTIKSNPAQGVPAQTVRLWEKLARIGIHLTALHDIAAAHDKISGNDVLGSECARTYAPIVANLKALHYPIFTNP